MSGFGQRLRNEREARDKTIEQVSEATGIGLSYLEALESDEFEALPGRAFGKLYIRAYAELLGFDPCPLIEAYDRERQLRIRTPVQPERSVPAGPRPIEAAITRWRQARRAQRRKGEILAGGAGEEREAAPAAPVEPAVAAPEPPREPEALPLTRPLLFHHPWRVALLFFGPLLVAAAAYQSYFRNPVQAVESPAPAAGPSLEALREHRVSSPPGPGGASSGAAPSIVTPAPKRLRAAAVAPRSPESPGIPEFGVGRGIVSRRLVGADERFSRGQAVWFATRVVGGRSGEIIRHVWLHEGRPQQSIELTLGGRDWRTCSRKTLWYEGRWAVEARDDAGRVLARSEFTCAAGP